MAQHDAADEQEGVTAPTSGRSLRIEGFMVILVAYLATIVVVGALARRGLADGARSLDSSETLIRATIVPVAASGLVAIAAITVLGWWPSVLRDVDRARPWVLTVPVVLIGSAVVMTDYGSLSDLGLGFTLTLAVAALCVGTAEELMFRGLALESFRRAGGYSRSQTALLTSVIFGAAHLLNATGGLGKTVIVAFAGFFFYLCRRASGGILMPIAVHAAWDFALLSQVAGPDGEASAVVLLAVVAYLGLGILLIVRRHRIETAHADPGRLTPG